jgi:exodeoxyribonuclease VII small subunit
MSQKVNSSKDFESAMNELEKIVSNMESGNADLEALVQNYQVGIELLSNCRSKLSNAEINIKEINKSLVNSTSISNDPR